MTADMELRHYTTHEADYLRPLLLDVYAEVYAKAAETDPFCAVDRFTEGLDIWSARPGWSCVIGYDSGQPVGYAYGAPLPPPAAAGGADYSPMYPPTPSPGPAHEPTHSVS
ncbi:hypothetical protein [Streptomyces sp. NPDC048155]|uniref:hypothetical protein n=1 Tax=Streptomyces sp. NPDC048155 TaxID=3154818 RepID=UPI0033C93276